MSNKYINANEVLPKRLISEIQKYVKGRHIYIPQTNRQTWGSSTGIKAELLKRNQEIVSKYKQGLNVKSLSGMYNLSEERIRGIIAANKIKRK